MPIIVNIAKFLKKHDYVVERYGNLVPAIFKDAVYEHRMNFIIKNPCRVLYKIVNTNSIWRLLVC
jgi:hypothetical protein